MIITENDAKKIREEVFGPCTVLYECGDEEEVMAQAAENSSVKALLESLYESESLFLEQRGNQWSGENEVQFREDVAGDKRFLSAIKERISLYLKGENNGR
jgi:hypothetical protein